MMQRSDNYPIVSDEVFSRMDAFIREMQPAVSQIFILADENTHLHCMAPLVRNVKVLEQAEILEIDAGENSKTMEIVLRLWEVLAENNVDRNALIVNLGGGMVSDLGGFMASVYKRGIRFINVPTSLLAMVDAAFGGKTGVNLGNLKNQLGCFSNPEAVFVWPGFLETLPLEEFYSGYGELIKYALIDSREMWNSIHEKGFRNIEDTVSFIKQAIDIKSKIVRQDPKESGLRKVLNFGHTYGHAFEGISIKQDTKLAHGHAVALGMICELWHSVHKKNFPENDFEEVSRFILNNFNHYPLSDEQIEEMTELMKNDKKNHQEKIGIVLLEDFGKPDYEEYLTIDEIRECLNFYSQFDF